MSDRDWLDWRREGIGASDVAALCGLSPWSSPTAVYLEKTGQILGQDETEPMRWGKLLEGAIAAEFSERTGYWVAGEQTWCEHPSHPHHRATVDGFVVGMGESLSLSIDEALGVLEIKTTSMKRWDEIPDHAYIQGQWQMWVTGKPKVWYAVLHNGRYLAIHDAERDDALIADLVEIVDEFWERVLTLSPPPIDHLPATADALARAYAETDPSKVVDLEPDLAELIAVRAGLKREIADLEDRVRHIENRWKSALGDAELGIYDGRRVLTWTPVSRRSYDTKGLAVDHPDIAAKYERTTEYRRLNVKEDT